MKSTNTQVAFIYLRVSTSDQAEGGVGLDAQKAKCHAHIERMGWAFGGVFVDEALSGRDGVEDRPGLAALLEKAKATPNSVIVTYSVSRLSRGRSLIWTIVDDREGLGLNISSATEPFDTATPMGRAMLGMISVWNALEADMVSERTKDALAAVKARGTKLGNPGIAALAPETVQLIKELYASGLYTQRAIVEELNRRNIPTARGIGRWHLTAVQAALKA